MCPWEFAPAPCPSVIDSYNVQLWQLSGCTVGSAAQRSTVAPTRATAVGGAVRRPTAHVPHGTPPLRRFANPKCATPLRKHDKSDSRPVPRANGLLRCAAARLKRVRKLKRLRKAARRTDKNDHTPLREAGRLRTTPWHPVVRSQNWRGSRGLVLAPGPTAVARATVERDAAHHALQPVSAHGLRYT